VADSRKIVNLSAVRSHINNLTTSTNFTMTLLATVSVHFGLH